jgi:Ankyrin repeats (3 copies)
MFHTGSVVSALDFEAKHSRFLINLPRFLLEGVFMILLKTRRFRQIRLRYAATVLTCCYVLGITQFSHGQNVLTVTVVNARWAVDQRDVGGDTAQGKTPLLIKVKIENKGNEPVLLEAKEDIVISVTQQNPKGNPHSYTLKGIYVAGGMMWTGTPEHIKLETQGKWADFYNLDNPGSDYGATYLFCGVGEFKLTFQPGGEMELPVLFEIPKSNLPMTLTIKNATRVSVNVLLAGTRASAQADDLINAANNGDLASVKALLAKGADVNAKTSYGWTALICASQHGHLEVVQALLAKGADVNAEQNNGRTALDAATAGGHADVIALLVKAGAKP